MSNKELEQPQCEWFNRPCEYGDLLDCPYFVTQRRCELTETRPKIVCLCGSTRFTKQMLITTWELAKKGIIALGWCLVPNMDGDHLAEKENVKEILDNLHKSKILLANEIMVINVGGYIGSSTRSEIQFAIDHKKPVQWLEPDKIPEEFAKSLK